MIHLALTRQATEVDHGPPLLYHLPAVRPGALPAGRRRPGRFPSGPRPLLPRHARTVPRRVRRRIPTEGPPPVPQAPPVPAAHPPEGDRRELHRPSRLRPAVHGRPRGRCLWPAVAAHLRRPLLGAG